MLSHCYTTVSRKTTTKKTASPPYFNTRALFAEKFQQKGSCCWVLIKKRAIITLLFLVRAQRMSNSAQFV